MLKPFWIKKAKINRTAAELEAAIGLAEQLPTVAAADTGKVLVVGDDGQIVASNVGFDERVAVIADAFSTSNTYSAGDYVIYNDDLYRFTADHAAGAWDADEVLNVKLADDVRNINNIVGIEWVIGSYIYKEGYIANATDRACSNYIPCVPYSTISYVGENNHANVCGVAFYDKLFGFISGDINSGTLGNISTVIAPAGTAYMRVSTKISILEKSFVKFSGSANSALMAASSDHNERPVFVDSQNGSDSNLGDYNHPFKTIAHALGTGARDIGLFTTAPFTETVTITAFPDIHLFGVCPSWSEDEVRPRPKAQLDGNETIATILSIENATRLILENIEVYDCTYNAVIINKCENIKLIDCVFHDNGNNGIVINNSNGEINTCSAYSNGHDGFNLNYYGHTTFINCKGYNNGDDGVSHHQGTTGFIDGGEWYGNVKGGIASPCYGAAVNIANVYTHDNGYGIYSDSSSESQGQAFTVWNSVITNNSQYGIAARYNTPTLYNNKISGNTTGQTTGYGTVNFVFLD